MAQIAIPLVIAGVLYLISNDKKSETFIDNPNKDEPDFIKNNIEKSSLQSNNEGIYSQYQDKYSHPIIDSTLNKEFKNLAGQNVNQVTHNNMTSFYNNKSNGAYNQLNFNNDNKLDNYTGTGSHIIEKSEVGCFFKPKENMQNVWGNQNQSDFFQSRVVESQRFANTKPWKEEQVAPGSNGFNSGMENREKWIDKTVDELRVANNPKSNYLQNYVAPAFKSADRGILGKIVKKGPDTYHMNSEIGGNAKGINQPTQMSEQMLTDENREHTSVSYYGTRAADPAGYITGKYDTPHKPELPTNPYINFAANQVFPSDDLGKGSYKSYTNNRNTDGQYLGAMKGFIANVVNPITNILKHTKKTNFVENNNSGNIQGQIQGFVNNQNSIPVTNRQIQANRVGLNYLQVDRSAGDGYMTANPYLIGQQRDTTNNQIMGVAGGLSGATSYNAEYNQRSFQKPIDNRTAIGNTNQFNNIVNVTLNDKEQSNRNTPVGYNPYAVMNRIMPTQTTSPQEYKNINNDYNHADMLKAFKENPYTKSLSSVA